MFEMILLSKVEFENQILVAWKILKKMFHTIKKKTFVLVEPAWLWFFYLTSFALSVSMSVSHNKYEWQQDTIAPLFIIGKCVL